jgi:hypothetical protein
MAEPSRLRLVLERVAESVHEPEFVTDAPLVSFEAFVAEHRVYGWVRLDADRLTDLLNAHDELLLANVLVEHLGSGRSISADEAMVRRSELIAVRASGPRGDAALRRETVPHAVVVESGPYRIGGFLHAAPGIAPELRVHGGEPMVPLTEGWIELRSEDAITRRRVGTIIVNRDLAESIELAPDGDAERSDGRARAIAG